MKKVILLSIITISLFAQNPWQIITQASFMETTGSPDELFFINENKGWLGGQLGIIYYTNDGGTTWTIQRDTSSTQETINDIFFLDSNHGWACGAGGTVLYTTDGGTTWTKSSNTSTTEDLNAVIFIDNNNGYACGQNGVIIKSTNGGLTWILQVTNTFSNLGGIAFWDSNKGFAFINSNVNGVLWTNSGGFVWSVANLPIPPSAISSRMYGCDVVPGTSQGWIAGYHGLVFKTTNNAQAWSLNANFFGSDFKIARDIDFADAQNGFVSANDGLIFRTTNGGTTWDTLNAGSNQNMVNLSVPTSQTIYVAGLYSQIRKSTDGGTTWVPVIEWPRTSFRSIGIADSLHITAGSFGGDATHSFDAGQTFSFPGNVTIPNSGNTNCVYFQNPALGFFAGQDAEIAKTTDGGISWTAANVTATDFKTIYGMSFINPSIGWAGASSGVIYKTTDGGDNWTQIYDIGSENIYDIYFLDDQNGFIVTNGGRIYKCTDGNTSWAVIDSFLNVDLYALEFVDSLTAFISAEDGILISSNDGGNNWSISDTLGFVVRDSLYLPDLRDIIFINPNEGWTVGRYGATFYSKDMGQSWQYNETATDVTLYSIDALSPKYGYISGDLGTILKYDPLSGIIESGIQHFPRKAKLKTNFPNPFNPTTTIKYYLNVSGYAELIIYNIKGKKVKTIFSGYQKPGDYNFTWNGKNENNIKVSSGAYFYQLKIDNELHAKRMILLK